MKIELEHDIAAMGFCRFHFHVQQDGDFLGTLALPQELQHLALPRRQFGFLGRGRTQAIPPQVTVHDQIGYSRAESALVAFQCLHRRLQVFGSIGLENPPSNPRIQTVADHLL